MGRCVTPRLEVVEDLGLTVSCLDRSFVVRCHAFQWTGTSYHKVFATRRIPEFHVRPRFSDSSAAELTFPRQRRTCATSPRFPSPR